MSNVLRFKNKIIKSKVLSISFTKINNLLSLPLHTNVRLNIYIYICLTRCMCISVCHHIVHNKLNI